MPYLMLGRLQQVQSKGKAAAAAYQQFLDHSSGTDGQRAVAIERLTEIKEILAATATP